MDQSSDATVFDRRMVGPPGVWKATDINAPCLFSMFTEEPHARLEVLLHVGEQVQNANRKISSGLAKHRN